MVGRRGLVEKGSQQECEGLREGGWGDSDRNAFYTQM